MADRSTQRFGAGGYQVFLYDRGLRTLVTQVQGWTQLAFDVRRSDVGQATVSFADIGAATEECRNVFRAAETWVHELVITRPDGFVWSGPLVSRSASGGTGTLTAMQVSQWGAMRFIHGSHNIKTRDATDAYAALWHDAVDPDNSMGWQLVITAALGETIPIQVKSTDHAIFTTAVQPLQEGGLDTVTIDRTTFVGPPDTTKIPTALVDSHLAAVPDFTEDGLQQATVYGVLGQTSGTNAAYGQAENGLSGTHGLLEAVVQSNTATTTRQAQLEARQGIATRGDARPVLTQITLARNAPFTVPILRPGRLWDVRLGLTPVAISDTYRISKVSVTVDGSQAGHEVIQIDVDQSNVAA